MRTLLHFSVKHPAVVLGGVILISAIMALFVPRVRLRLDARSLVPAGHPDLAASDATAQLFNLHDLVIIGVRNPYAEIYQAETLARIDRLSKALANIKGVVPSSVSSITTRPRSVFKENQLDLRSHVENLGLNDGILVSPDHKMALIVAEINSDADRQVLLEEVEKLADAERTAGDSIYLSGTALAQATLGEASARDLMYLVPIVVLVLGAALTLAFRNPLPALISLTEIGVSLLWTTGLIGMTGRSIFVTTLIMPVILISVGVSDDVYVLTRYFSETGGVMNREQVERVFTSLRHTITVTTISTVVGLLSLTVTSLEPLIVFGVFGALAIVFSTLFTFSLVPALLILFNPRMRRVKDSAGHLSERIPLFIFRTVLSVGRLQVFALTLLIAIGALILTTRSVVDDSWIRNLPANSVIASGDRAINEFLAGSTTLNLMIDERQDRGLLQPSAMMRLITLEQRLNGEPYVGATYGIHHEILRLSALLRGMSYGAYREALQRGDEKLTTAEIEQALMLLTLTQRAPLTAWIDKNQQRARLTVFIRSADYKRIDQVLGVAQSSNGVITPFGDAWISYTTVRLLVEGQGYSIVLALLTDLILLSLLFKSVKLALTAIMPITCAVLVVFAVLTATQTPIGIANSMFAGISIGIGLDFAIHLTAAYRRQLADGWSRNEAVKNALVRTAPSIVTSALAIATGFFVLVFSQIRPNAQLGLMICLNLVLCAIATLILVPATVMARSSRQEAHVVSGEPERLP